MAKKMIVNDLQVTERSQCAKIDLLSCRGIRTVRQGLDVGRKILNPLDLMPWQKDAAKFRQVKPFVGGALYATEVEIERVNVHVGFHWRAQKKQEPPPKERLRALLVKQSGVMMTRFLPVAWAVVKSRLIVRILLSTGRAIRLRIIANSCRSLCLIQDVIGRAAGPLVDI